MATKNKKTKLAPKTKFSFKNPALVIVVTLLVAVGVFFAFKTFAADGTISASGTKSPTDAYGCPLDSTKRPELRQGSFGGCVKTLQKELNNYHVNLPYLTVDGSFGTQTANSVKLMKQYHNDNRLKLSIRSCAMMTPCSQTLIDYLRATVFESPANDVVGSKAWFVLDSFNTKAPYLL